jgi:hypothetical protein
MTIETKRNPMEETIGTKIRNINRHLPVNLSDDEVRVRGIELANLAKRHIDLQDEKKSTAKAYKDQIDAVNSQIIELKDVVRNAVEIRAVECERRYDTYLGRVTTVRKDTGDVIEVRMMNASEMQGDLFAIDATERGVPSDDSEKDNEKDEDD